MPSRFHYPHFRPGFWGRGGSRAFARISSRTLGRYVAVNNPTALGPTGAHLGGLSGGDDPAAGAPSPVPLFRPVPRPPHSARPKTKPRGAGEMKKKDLSQIQQFEQDWAASLNMCSATVVASGGLVPKPWLTSVKCGHAVLGGNLRCCHAS
jgi:hypothetical protein